MEVESEADKNLRNRGNWIKKKKVKECGFRAMGEGIYASGHSTRKAWMLDSTA